MMVMDLRVTSRNGSLPRIGSLEIQRQTPLRLDGNVADEVHMYTARHHDGYGAMKVREIEHRYGDGAWVLLSKTIKEFGLDTPGEMGSLKLHELPIQ